MTYALLQTSMAPPPVDALKRAFRNSRSLSAADAVWVADDAFGILARDLPEDEGQSLAAMLTGEGVGVELVADRDLPRLPDAQFFLSTQFQPDTLELFDALERAEKVPWPAVRLIAVGSDRGEVRLEIVGGDAVMRFFTTMGKLHFHHSPEVGGTSAADRFIHLLRKLRHHAPGAVLNRGARLLIEAGPVHERVEDLVAYPRLSAFHEESTWLLWRARQAEAEAEVR